MLYHFIYPFSDVFSFFNVFRYITTRSFFSFVIATLFVIFCGKIFIRLMKSKQFGQVIREDGPESHFKKAGTPTMGGVLIGFGILAAVVICGNFSSAPVLGCLIIALSFFVLGWLDDYLKIIKKNSDGISAKGKLFWQFATAVIVLGALVWFGKMSTELYVPFVKGPIIDLGWVYILFGAFVIVGSSNAVNLTDGLDGLAAGPILSSSACLGLLAYVAGHSEISSYLFIPFIEGGGELVVLAAACVGATAGFLWYNTYPAQMMMGDVGSLSLGGILGSLAVLTKNEFLFLLVGGIFVIEALSVILQVGYYKKTKKRIFKMAPIHHHFEKLGWPEPKITIRFWIISVLFSILAIATLKLR